MNSALFSKAFSYAVATTIVFFLILSLMEKTPTGEELIKGGAQMFLVTFVVFLLLFFKKPQS